MTPEAARLADTALFLFLACLLLAGGYKVVRMLVEKQHKAEILKVLRLLLILLCAAFCLAALLERL